VRLRIAWFDSPSRLPGDREPGADSGSWSEVSGRGFVEAVAPVDGLSNESALGASDADEHQVRVLSPWVTRVAGRPQRWTTGLRGLAQRQCMLRAHARLEARCERRDQTARADDEVED
jgi:hypothetical protein